MVDDSWLTCKQAARLSGRNENWIARECQRGVLTAVKVPMETGGPDRWSIDPASLAVLDARIRVFRDPEPTRPGWLTKTQAAKVLGMKPDGVLNLLAYGKLRGEKIGSSRSWQIDPQSVMEHRWRREQRAAGIWPNDKACVRCGIIEPLNSQHLCEVCERAVQGLGTWYPIEPLQALGTPRLAQAEVAR